MSMNWVQLSCVLLIMKPCFSANILGIVPTPSHSHQVAFRPFWKELSLRGHKVTVVTTDPVHDPNLTNLTEIDTSWSYQYFSNISKLVEKELNMWNAFDLFKDVMQGIAEGQLSYEPVQELMNLQNNKFDVILVESVFPEFLGFAEIHKCPNILISSLDILSQHHRLIGNPSHPVLNPELMTPFYGDLVFKERLISTIYDWYQTFYANKKSLHLKDNILRTYFNTSRTVSELISDVDMLFLNINPVIQGVRSLGPSTITIGGYKRETSLKSLPMCKTKQKVELLPNYFFDLLHDLQSFLDSAKDGFVYFSLGSNVKSKDLKPATLNAIIETLRELPYKVLWKFEADELPGKPDNVKLIKWVPQQSVLAHPNIKLFVMQGGLQSMEEAIYSDVPMVVIPFFADQEQNAKLMKSKGIDIIVEVRPYLKKNELKTAMLEVINNPQYRNAVKRLKQLALDTPMSGLEKAVWWTEYVIRNKGAKHLKNPAADIPYYQYFLLDVIGFLLGVSVTVIFVLFFVIRRLYRFIKENIFLNKTMLENKLKKT